MISFNDKKYNIIIDMIEETDPTIPIKLYNRSCINCNPILFLEENTITETI